jgi:heat shock protein HtpX
MFKNTLKTFTLLAGLAGSFILVGSVLSGPTGIAIGTVFGFGLVGSSYWFSDRLAVRSAQAVEVLPGQLDWLRSDLAVLAERAGMVSPRLFVSPDA